MAPNILDMHRRKKYTCINFQQSRVSRSVKTVHTNLIAKKLQIKYICNLQLEFRIITPFGHARPPNGHSGRFRDQSAYYAIMYIKLPQKEIICTDDRRTDG